jgi:cytochrome c-type biogenesis protein CcmE
MEDKKPQQSEGRAGRLRLIVGLLLGVSAFYLVLSSMGEGGSYFYTVDEVADEPVKDRPIRVKGTVVQGTYVNAAGSNEHFFTITEKEKTMKVFYKGPLPDVFGEGREVVAEGRRDASGRLVATEVTAKCPSKYEGDGVTEEARERMNQSGS